MGNASWSRHWQAYTRWGASLSSVAQGSAPATPARSQAVVSATSTQKGAPAKLKVGFRQDARRKAHDRLPRLASVAGRRSGTKRPEFTHRTPPAVRRRGIPLERRGTPPEQDCDELGVDVAHDVVAPFAAGYAAWASL